MKTKIDTEKEIKIFDELISSLSEPRKSQVEEMMKFIGERYFTAPASGSILKHDAFPGGLLHHSLQVAANFKKLCNLFYPDVNKDSIIISALFHDLGKIGSLDGKELYIPVKEQWKRDRGNVYEYNPDIRDGLTHAQRSVRILSHFGIQLTDEEYLAIISHDGLFLDENQVYRNKMNKLSYLLHWADISTTLLDK